MRELATLLDKSLKELDGLYHSPHFLNYETGLIGDDEFRDAIRSLTSNTLSNAGIDEAWNAMLLGLPAKRLELVSKLSTDYQLLVLSNTNAIHVKKFNQYLKANTGRDTLNDFFDVVYFSHEIKMRKPDEEIYQFVIDENNLNPEDTLFLDDNKLNLEAAQRLGIRTRHIEYPDQLFEIF